MRWIWAVPTFLALVATAALGNGLATNAEDLRELLIFGHQPATIEKAASRGGCTPTECSTHVDGLSISREKEAIRRTGGGQIRLEQHGPGAPKDLPDLDWEPDAGFKVFRAGRRWGTCLEFSHGGMGKSGRFQRWRSVVLVPWRKGRPASVAHRFVGYWANCGFLVEGGQAGEVMLPIIEPVALGSRQLHLVWQRCSAERCVTTEDSRRVGGDPGGEDGSLTIGEK